MDSSGKANCSACNALVAVQYKLKFGMFIREPTTNDALSVLVSDKACMDILETSAALLARTNPASHKGLINALKVWASCLFS